MISVRFIDSINNISKLAWTSVSGSDYPFTRYEFLSSLETSGAVTIENGWQPHHALMYDHDELIAVMPAYLKYHSYGEFVFDFQWAAAYQQHGLAYYPKLITAIPFSPVTGPRICIKPGQDSAEIIRHFVAACLKYLEENKLSSWHILFTDEATSRYLSDAGLLTRRAVHFQWLNNRYGSFDDFLSACNSRHRKNIRKEREQVKSQGIILHRLMGNEITPGHWQNFYHFYQLTYAKYTGQGGYLGPEFFYTLGKELPDQLMMVLASKDGKVVAAALNLKDTTTLYGRYWGCLDEFDFLHFETCYYQGIEYCIEHGLQRFDPGVQGEHKIQRGFRPVFTRSSHHIADGRFREAIQLFLKREDAQIERYQKEAGKRLPFKHT